MTAPTPDTDVAYAAGAEAMREACAHTIEDWIAGGIIRDGLPTVLLTNLAKVVRRLPLPPAPETQTETSNGTV